MISDRFILLIEDNPDDEFLTLRALKKSRIQNEVRVVRDGAEAIDFLFGPGAETRPLPQLVLLDLKLPKIDGLDVLKRIRSEERTKILPVVILTSSKEEGDVIQGYGRGANSYVCKPVDPQPFMEAVQQLEIYWMILNEHPAKR